MNEMKTLFAFIALTGIAAVQQKIVIVQPRLQSSFIFNPANPNRAWVDYKGRSGLQREQQAVTLWKATTVPSRMFPQTTGGVTVIWNPHMR